MDIQAIIKRSSNYYIFNLICKMKNVKCKMLTQGQERAGVFNETGRNCRWRGLITAPNTAPHLPLS